jgi:hypothetical protein
MNQAALDYLKKNVKKHLNDYRTKADPEIWLSKEIGEPAFTEIDNSIIKFDYVELYFSKKNNTRNEVENIKNFYLSLSDVNVSFASDERLWAGLSHTLYRDFIYSRWAFDKLDDSALEKSIMNHCFFNFSVQRSYMVNTLARYWWIGYKLYQPSNESNPFYILDFVSSDINGMLFELFGVNYPNNPKLMKTFFDSLISFKKQYDIDIDRNNLNEVKRYLNYVGGKQILDLCSKEKIQDLIIGYLKAMYKL